MKIRSSETKGRGNVGSASKVGGSSRRGRGYTASTRGGGADSVRLSSIAGQLAASAASVEEPASGASPERLAELKAAIEDGSYPIDVKALAAAILKEDMPEGERRGWY